MKESKPVIIIPAYNEENHIKDTVKKIRKTGINSEIIVVSDGSTDKTTKKAKEAGCKVIEFKENRGKTNAFLAGVKKALEMKSTAVISMDADMVRIPKKELKEIVSRAEKATKKRKIRMVIAPVYEPIIPKGPKISAPKYSGVRAFSVPALYKLRSSKFKSLPKGFGLEVFLNVFFSGKTTILPKKRQGFEAKTPGRSHARKEAQRRDIEKTQRGIQKRLKWIWKKNRKLK